MTTPLREILARFGFEFEEAAAARAEGFIDRVTGAASRFGQTLIAGASAVGIASFIQGQIDLGGELEEVSGRLGISATELRAWRLAASEAGASSESVERAIARVGLVAANAPASIRSLGVATRGANGELRSASEIFRDAGLALNAVENDTERAARATAIFGRSGREVLRVFEGGAEAVDGYRERVRRLYGTDLDQLAAMSDRAGDAQAEFDLALDAVSTRIAITVLPSIARMIESGVMLVTTFQEWVQHSRFAEAALITIGAIAVAVGLATIEAWGPPLAVFLLMAAAVAAVVLVLDDLMVAADGGNSVIGRLGDSLLGVGGTQAALQAVVTILEALRDVAAEAWEIIRPIGEFLARGAVAEFASTLGVARAGVAAGRGFLGASPGLAGGTPGEVAGGVTDLFGVGASLIPGGGAVTSLINGARSLVRNVTTGPITVNGASDPETTARAVVGEIERRAAAESDDDAADLLPVGTP